MLTPSPSTPKTNPSSLRVQRNDFGLNHSSTVDSGLLLFNWSATRRPCAPPLIPCITALPFMEWLTEVTVVGDIWPVICNDRERRMAFSLCWFISSVTHLPEKDLSREGDMDSVPGKTPWQNNFRCSYIDSIIYSIIIYSIIAVEHLLLCSCLTPWRYMTGQSRKNPWPHGASILPGETENKSKDKWTWDCVIW